MHVAFQPEKINWADFISAQQWGAGRGQYGGNNVFHGIPFQRGSGIGSIFKSLVRYLLPLGKEVGISIVKQGLESGNNILNNVLEGNSLKDSSLNEGKKVINNLLNKNSSNQDGKGLTKYKKVKSKKCLNKNLLALNKQNLHSLVGPEKNKKRIRKDSLGHY